jgi:hypothetical protein
MSKRLIGVVAAAVCVVGFVVPSTASAVTRATGVGVYAKGPSGWVKDCRAAPVGPYIVSIYRCYVEEINGSARLCAQIRVQDLRDIVIGGSYIDTLQCSDPNAPGAATAGAFRFSA